MDCQENLSGRTKVLPCWAHSRLRGSVATVNGQRWDMHLVPTDMHLVHLVHLGSHLGGSGQLTDLNRHRIQLRKFHMFDLWKFLLSVLALKGLVFRPDPSMIAVVASLVVVLKD